MASRGYLLFTMVKYNQPTFFMTNQPAKYDKPKTFRFNSDLWYKFKCKVSSENKSPKQKLEELISSYLSSPPNNHPGIIKGDRIIVFRLPNVD
jgi:hypothetical protein